MNNKSAAGYGISSGSSNTYDCNTMIDTSDDSSESPNSFSTLLTLSPSFNLLSFLKSGEYYDFLVIGPEKKEYPLHRIALSQSDFFKCALQGNWKESISNSVQEPRLELGFDVTKEIWEEVLYFLYSGQIHVSIETIVPILTLADQLQISNLSQLIKNYLTSESFPPADLVIILQELIELEGLKSFTQDILEQLAKVFNEIPMDEDLSFLDFHHLYQLISFDSFKTNTEYQLYRVLSNYCRDTVTLRKRDPLALDQIKQLFEKVFFENMTHVELEECGKNSFVPKEMVIAGLLEQNRQLSGRGGGTIRPNSRR